MRPILSESRLSFRSLVPALLLAGVLLLVSLRGVDWNEVTGTVRQGRAEDLALACLALSISCFIRGLRWRVILSATHLIAPVTVFWATMVGYLGNSLLPARAGEFLRVVLIGRSANISKSYVLATALTERVLDVPALATLSLLALALLGGVPSRVLPGTGLVAALGLVAVFGILVAPRLAGTLKQLLDSAPLPSVLRAQAIEFLERFILGLVAFRQPARSLSFAFLTVVIWLIDALVAIITAGALGLTLTLPQALLLLTALGLSSAAPSTPGYVGIYQFVAITVLAPFAFAPSQALALIITLQAVTYAVFVLWGTVGWWRLTGARAHAAPMIS